MLRRLGPRQWNDHFNTQFPEDVEIPQKSTQIFNMGYMDRHGKIHLHEPLSGHMGWYSGSGIVVAGSAGADVFITDNFNGKRLRISQIWAHHNDTAARDVNVILYVRADTATTSTTASLALCNAVSIAQNVYHMMYPRTGGATPTTSSQPAAGLVIDTTGLAGSQTWEELDQTAYIGAGISTATAGKILTLYVVYEELK